MVQATGGAKEVKFPTTATVCDIYVALTEKRPYKEPWSPKEALDYIKRESGKTFCPNLVGVFESLLAQAA